MAGIAIDSHALLYTKKKKEMHEEKLVLLGIWGSKNKDIMLYK